MAISAVRNAMVAIGAATSTLLSEQKTTSRRVSLEICNLNVPGADDVFVSVDEEAVANYGRRIQPGQTITWSKDGGYMPPQGRVNGVAAAATNVSVYEEIEAV